ncbi:MAG: hypothetical protein SGJ20_13175 [Planctomycetota bacterium]|nr:hypothetical protein [Planctomycetota bacterium]
MIARTIAVVLGLFVGAILTVLMVQPGIDLFRKFLGKDRCYGSEALNGGSTWIVGVLMCGVVVYYGWPTYGFWGLVFVPLVSMAATLFWTASFCLGGWLARKREFNIEDHYCPVIS